MQTTKAMSIAFSLYNLAWSTAIPFLKRKPRISDGFRQRLLDDELPTKADIWIQSASAGEAYLTAEILANLDVMKPMTLWLTTNTRQGLDILEQTRDKLRTEKPGLKICVSFTPFDKPTIMEKAVRLVRPKLMVLVELEMWPGLLRSLKENRSKILIVNGRLTQKSLDRYLLFPSLWTALAPDEICAMSDDDAQRFSRLFPESVIRVVPNIKFDRIAPIPDQIEDNPLAALFKTPRPLVVLGSVRQEEENQVDLIIRKIIHENPEVTVLLFPRHMHRIQAWSNRLDDMGITWRTRSRLSDCVTTDQVILWDRFGELSQAYALAQAAFVGGSLAPLGGQNFLEVLQCGLIPVSGPHWSNFSWVGEDIIKHGLLIIEHTWEHVSNRLLAHVDSAIPRDIVRQKALHYLDTMKGGTRKTCERILDLMNHIP